MKKYISMAVALAFTLSATNLYAVKAWPGLQKLQQPDGTIIEYRMIGDEYYHEMVTEDGYILTQGQDGVWKKAEKFDNESFIAKGNRARLPRKKLINDNFPTKGDLKGIVIMVEFADNEFTEGHDRELFQSMMNDKGFNYGGATGSVRDYFVDQSSGIFTPEFDVYGPVKLSRNMSYYGQNNSMGSDSHPEKMVSEACRYLEEKENVDFTRYDFDGDGTVDFVYIYYAGYAESYGASSNTIWPHASNLTLLGEYCEVSGKRVDRYACSSELKYISGHTLEGIGTFCHEFSHVLGLPDMYHTSMAGYYQLGPWDLMDQGNYNNNSHTPPSMSAFERSSLHWLELTELDTPSDRVELPEMTSSNFAYRVSTPVDNEFFTLENRQQVGWDAYQPAKGLMIIHITYEPSAWSGNYVNSGIIQRYDLVEADGIQNSSTASGDLFPYYNVDSFTDYTTPSSLTWDGIPTEKGITMIRDEEGLITFKFMKDRFKTPVLDDVTEIGSDYFVIGWRVPDDAESYKISLREFLPSDENPVVFSEDFEKLTKGNYPNSDYVDISSELDEYLNMPGWSGQEVYQAGGEVQIGRYAESGNLVSPVIKADETVGCYTLTAFVVSYPGKSVNYTVKVVAASNGEIIWQQNDKVNKNGNTILYVLENPGKDFNIIFETSAERMFIDNIRLAKEEWTEDEIWNIGAKSWDIYVKSADYSDGYMQVRVEGLIPGRSYAFKVMAESSDIMHGSEPTDEIIVTTLDSGAGMEAIQSNKMISREFYDINGLRTTAEAQGFKIIVETMANGDVVVRKTFNK